MPKISSGLNKKASNPLSLGLLKFNISKSPQCLSPISIFQSTGIRILCLPTSGTTAELLKLSKNINGYKKVVWICRITII